MFNKENINCLLETNSGSSQKVQIDGQSFINPILERQSLEQSNLEKFEEEIHKLVYENLDTNSSIRNVIFPTLF